MNNKPQYGRKGSGRNQLVTALCENGAVPYDFLTMFPYRLDYMEKLAHRMNNEGIVNITWNSKNPHKRKKIITFTNFSKALPQIGKGLSDIQIDTYQDKQSVGKDIRFGEEAKQIRLYRNIESNMFFHYSNIPTYTNERQALTSMRNTDNLAFYPSREIKAAAMYQDDVEQSDGVKKIIGSRMSGLYVSPGGVYSVFNSGKGKTRYEKTGELKMKMAVNYAMEITNNISKKNDTGIILHRGVNLYNALFADTSENNEWGLNSLMIVYPELYLVEVSDYGRKILQIMGEPSWRIKILNELISPEIQTKDMRFDGYDQDRKEYILFGGISDITSLQTFIWKAKISKDMGNDETFTLICFEFQEMMFRDITKDICNIQVCNIDELIKCCAFNVFDTNGLLIGEDENLEIDEKDA